MKDHDGRKRALGVTFPSVFSKISLAISGDGSLKPDSQREIVLTFTPTRSAKSFCVEESWDEINF